MVRIGLLTTASINENLLATRTTDAPYEFVAVSSRELGRAAAYAQRWGIDRPFGSYEELLTSDDIDAVYIALPNALHFKWTMRARSLLPVSIL